MKKILDEIRSGQFAEEWIAENRAGLPQLQAAPRGGRRRAPDREGRRRAAGHDALHQRRLQPAPGRLGRLNPRGAGTVWCGDRRDRRVPVGVGGCAHRPGRPAPVPAPPPHRVLRSVRGDLPGLHHPDRRGRRRLAPVGGDRRPTGRHAEVHRVVTTAPRSSAQPSPSSWPSGCVREDGADRSPSRRPTCATS